MKKAQWNRILNFSLWRKLCRTHYINNVSYTGYGATLSKPATTNFMMCFCQPTRAKVLWPKHFVFFQQGVSLGVAVPRPGPPPPLVPAPIPLMAQNRGGPAINANTNTGTGRRSGPAVVAAGTSLHSSNDSGFSNGPPPAPEVDYSDDEASRWGRLCLVVVA